jgi:hypothetical protein
LEKPVLLNQLEMQVLNRHCKVNQSNRLRKVWGVNQSSHLYKAMDVAQFNSRTLISPIGLLMEIWRSVLLEFYLTPLTG